ncbi:MAG: curli production assembly/transport component CsgG domain protein [Leptospira sp.]|nr:curli production assembly/transport component CsgG domain protein [Leptospira sp.]
MKTIQKILIPCIIVFASSCFWDDERRRSNRSPAPNPIQILSQSLSEGGFRIRGKRIIVLTFYDRDNSKADPRLGELISEKLTTELVKRDQFQVLDRGIYGKILRAKGMSLDGDVDMLQMKKIATQLKVDGIITGIIYKYGDGIFVNARLLEIDTGLILKAEEVFVAVNG